MKYTFRLANIDDCYQLSKLYHEVYEGTYPDPTMKDYSLIKNHIEDKSNYWFVVTNDSKVVGCVVYLYEKEIIYIFSSAIINYSV